MASKENPSSPELFTFYINESLTHIEAYPKAGKTSLATSLALDAAIYCNQKVLFFSPGKEQKKDIYHRLFSALKKWELDRVEDVSKNPTSEVFDQYEDTMFDLRNLKLIIEPTNDLSFTELRRLCLFHAHYQKVSLIIIDDFHLIRDAAQIRHIQELKKMADILRIPCILFTPLPTVEDADLRGISQLNVYLDTCSDLCLWLDRPVYEIEAQLEMIKIPMVEGTTPIPLTFNPLTRHFTDIEMIGLHLATAHLQPVDG